MSLLYTVHRWFSGRMLACHAGGPGSIPGRCKFCFGPTNPGKHENKKSFGGAGYRSRYLSHAKRALYHLSYAPSMASCPDIVKSVPGRQQSKQVFKDKLRSLNQNDDLCKLTFCHLTFPVSSSLLNSSMARGTFLLMTSMTLSSLFLVFSWAPLCMRNLTFSRQDAVKVKIERNLTQSRSSTYR